MTLPSANVTDGAASRIGSISKMSSLPPLSTQGIAPPRSLPSAMSSHRSSERVISALNRWVIPPSPDELSASSSSLVTIAG